MAGPVNSFADGARGWIAIALGTLILVMLLRAHGLGVGPIMILAVLGSLAAGVVLARNRTGSGARAILTALALVVAVMIVLPVLALSILFLGCAACRY